LRLFICQPDPERSEGEGSRLFAEPVLSGVRFFATLRMTGREGRRMTGEGFRMTGKGC